VTCHPTLLLSTTALTVTGITPPNCNNSTDPTCGGMPTTAGPVYAEYNPTKNLLVVADYAGNTISVIDVSLDEYGNDSATFGTTYTIPVGNNPASVTVLLDGSRAYTANQTDKSVTIANLSSYTAEKTLPVTGYPRTVVSTQNSTYGKVYVGSPNSNYLTILRTDQDIVDTTVLLEGDIVDVRVTTQDGSRGNNNVTSRIPGYGQPCNLPPGVMVSTYGASYTLANCQKQP
jgi:DNA-binding beta-propeller fold protein YncE